MWTNTERPIPSEAPKRAPVPLTGDVTAPASAPVPTYINRNQLVKQALVFILSSKGLTSHPVRNYIQMVLSLVEAQTIAPIVNLLICLIPNAHVGQCGTHNCTNCLRTIKTTLHSGIAILQIYNNILSLSWIKCPGTHPTGHRRGMELIW